MKKKEEVTITFYAAECGEFHDLGEYTKMIGIESCRFNITGQNLLSFYNPYPDNFIDPMTTYGNYPTLRKFTIGVNLTF